MFFHQRILLILVFSLGLSAVAQDGDRAPDSTPPSGRNKIEELFIWKISDELKLSTKEEKKFTDLFKDLNKQKSEALRKQDEVVTKLSQAKTEKERAKLLSDYRKLIEEYNKVQIREFDELKKDIGPERLAKYLQVKRDLNNKVKTLLTDKSDKKDAELPPPKVIEE